MGAYTQQVPLGVEVIETADFNEEELNSALQAINATELLSPRRPGEWADPHVQALRDLLRHPGTFGLYAALHASGDVSSIQNLTWSRLIEQYVRQALGRTWTRCAVTPEALREELITLAKLAREEKARDLRLPIETVKRALPDLEVDRVDPTQSRYAALREYSILQEFSATAARRFMGFAIPDVGSYLLSLDLERAAQRRTQEELRELAASWLQEAYDYPPLLDAILAWVDRLVDNLRDPSLLILLDALVDSPFRTEVVFRLVRPTVIGALFAAIKQEEPHRFYSYGEAAKAVRPASDALEEIRCYLRDRNPRARQLAAQLAGLHRDTASITGLIELLEDDEEAVHEAAYTALGRIGKLAVAPLLAIIGDASQSTERRSRCLGTLHAIGFRNDEVSAALANCLQYGQAGDISLLRGALLAAAYLRDPMQIGYAIDALSSDDWQVVQAAAKLLTETPDPSAWSALQEALRRGSSHEERLLPRTWVLRQLLAALTQLERAEATEVVLQTIREGVQGLGGLTPVEAIWAADDLGLPETHCLILEDLVRRLDNAPSDRLLWHSLRRLSMTWQPDHLAALSETTHQLTAQNINIAQQIVNGIIEGVQATDDSPLRDEHAQTYALCTLAKCQPENFVAEVIQLLQHVNGPLILKICEDLWVVGDCRAEGALLRKLEQPTSEDRLAWFERSRVIRALGTCGTERGAEAILAYLRSEQTISTSLPGEAIWPLRQRGVLARERLIEIVQNTEASIQGRTAAIIALGFLDVPESKGLCHEIIDQVEDETLRAYAVRMLGMAQDGASIAKLQPLLRKTKDAFVAEQAALALARLNAHQAVSDIECALEGFAETEHAVGLVNALERLRRPSSLPVLREALERSRFLRVRAEIIEALGAFLPDRDAKHIILKQLETWRGGNIDLGEQCPAIRALARYDPNLLLSLVKNLYNAGRLDRSAREELACWIPLLTRRDYVEKTALLGLIKKLVCDQYLPVRERVAQTFDRIDPTFCVEIYTELRRASDDWAQACAVYTLGFWESDEREVQSARYAEAFLIRYAGDAALEMRRRHRALQQLVEQYRSTNNLARLSAYLAIEEQGDEQTIWALRDTVQETDLAHAFLQQLASDVQDRLRDERRKRADEEQRLLAAAGTVRFN